MIHHVQISVRDFAKSLRFYSEALGQLGFTAQSVDDAARSAGFGPPGKPQLWIGVGTPSKGVITATSLNMIRENGRENRAKVTPVISARLSMPKNASTETTTLA